MRNIPLALGLITLLLAACTNAPSPGGEGDVSEPGSTRIVEISAANWEFSPVAITAKKGEKITVRLTSTEGKHGFAVPDLGINTVVSPGKTVDVELPTDTAGEFSFRCSVPCGPGHNDMKGTIVISE